MAKQHQKMKRQRRGFHHKAALALVRHYDVLYLEDLRVANLVRNRHLAKSISHAGWARFRTTLSTKQHMLVSKWCWWPPPTRRRTAQHVGRASRSA